MSDAPTETSSITPAMRAAAKALLARTPLDKKGKVSLVGADLVRFLHEGLGLLPGGERDRYGNHVFVTSRERTRYHFTPQRLQFQRRGRDDWHNVSSFTFKEAAQSMVQKLAVWAEDEELIQRTREGAKKLKAEKTARADKADAARAAAGERVRLAVALELVRPELLRGVVLDNDRASMAEAQATMKTLQPVPEGFLDEAPGHFLLAPFALAAADQPSTYGYLGTLRDGRRVTIMQSPLASSSLGRTSHLVQQCDLHIGDVQGTVMGLRVSPRGGRAFSMPSAYKASGPGYLSATFDRFVDQEQDVVDVVKIRSELFFLQASEKRTGVGRALVQLWLEHCLAAVGGDPERLELWIKSIVDDAWPFWEALDKAGVYTILGGHGSTVRIVPGASRGLR